MLKEQFNIDLQQGKEGEAIVAQYLSKQGYQVEDVSDKRQDYHKGDLLITLPTGEKRYVEVKNDTVIGKTQNILCEEEVYYKDKGYFAPGFMYSNYDIYAVVSMDQQEIYFFDFSKLKEIYKRFGRYKKFNYPHQYSECFLLELCRAIQFKAFYGKVKY